MANLERQKHGANLEGTGSEERAESVRYDVSIPGCILSPAAWARRCASSTVGREAGQIQRRQAAHSTTRRFSRLGSPHCQHLPRVTKEAKNPIGKQCGW